jgi:uncharacterized membrane protein HdeD (DUF308 family)
LIARGLAGLVLGGLILFQPGLSIDALAPLVGIFFCAIGLLRIVAGAADSEYATAIRVANVAFGLILVALGALAIRYPVAGLLFTVMTVGFAWMMEGAVSLAFLPARHQGRGWVIGFAVISLLAGLTLILWPASSLLPLVIVVGAFLLVGGVVDLLNAATLKPGVNLPAME